VEEAQAYPFSREERAFVEDFRAKIFVGSPRSVRTRLEALAAETHADELMISTVVHDHAARRRSYELLAEVFGHKEMEHSWQRAA
jgi:alkanesulfonate monooxygenase SsuD/methylene tetrahydromethanopterin reductase-like flavin-dependent oxidoreductase (luciferase family)